MTTAYPRTTGALRQALAAHGFQPRKRHGQHFLTDPQAVDAIVRDAAVRAGDHVVEIGTGVGLLTHALAETGAAVTSFELDGEALALAQALRTWPARVEFVHGDALAGKHALSPLLREALERRPPPPGRLLVVSNLPYGAGTPIVLGILGLEHPPDLLVVMLQREVVEKMLSPPGSASYGAPSVLVGLRAEGHVLRRFGPQVFWPRPKVESAVVALEPHPEGGLGAADYRAFSDFTTALFTRRRKVLPTALRQAAAGLAPGDAVRAVQAVGLDPRVRVQDVSPEALLRLWCAARQRGERGVD